MKILHAADLHLGTPFTGRSEAQVAQLRKAQLAVPGLLADLCRRESCDMILLSGDLFDSAHSFEGSYALRAALEEAAVPVFISPGNHDFCCPDSPFITENWPKNVHIFTQATIESVVIEALDCRVYGAGYTSMDCDPLLADFRAEGNQRHHIAVLHADPTQANSSYSPVTAQQIRRSGLDYLALGHIHKSGSLRCGDTLCAWPGCPMGRGFDELDAKGVLIVTVEDTVRAEFVPLDTPRFYDHEAPGADAAASLSSLLPAVANDHFYRVTFTGESAGVDIAALTGAFSQFPNLELRDRTVPEKDIWGSADEDSLEGVYFRLLKDALTDADENTQQALTLAARISRQILDGQEVVLP